MVRHQVLVLAFGGSNPSSPAKLTIILNYVNISIMNMNERCDSCIGERKMNCEAARAAVRVGLEMSTNLDPDLQAEALLEITRRTTRTLGSIGCELPASTLQQQLTQS